MTKTGQKRLGAVTTRALQWQTRTIDIAFGGVPRIWWTANIRLITEGDADVHARAPGESARHTSSSRPIESSTACRRCVACWASRRAATTMASAADLEPSPGRCSAASTDSRVVRASQGIYGAPRVFLDLREAGETCSKHRVARLMREANLRALHGYRMRRWSVGKPSVLIPNLLQRQFTVTRPTRRGSPILRTFGRGRAGSTWPSSWTCSRARSSAGPPVPAFSASSCSTPC